MKLLTSYFILSIVTLVMSPDSIAVEEAEDGIWIDVRSAQEYRQGHIEGAINIPHGDIGHKMIEFVDDPSIPVHLYDGTGVFAGLALELLMEMGFEYVINEGTYQSILEKQDD